MYFFWEPSLRALALGKYSALREVQWVQGVLGGSPQLRWAGGQGLVCLHAAARPCADPILWLPAAGCAASRCRSMRPASSISCSMPSTYLPDCTVIPQLTADIPSPRYYYMGYYIHSCPKMRYKADYGPCELLCPRDMIWVRLGPELLAALDQCKYVVLGGVEGAQVGLLLVAHVLLIMVILCAWRLRSCACGYGCAGAAVSCCTVVSWLQRCHACWCIICQSPRLAPHPRPLNLTALAPATPAPAADIPQPRRHSGHVTGGAGATAAAAALPWQAAPCCAGLGAAQGAADA